MFTLTTANRKNTLAFHLLIASLLVFVSEAYAKECGGVEISVAGLNVRSGPTTSDDIAGLAHKNEAYVLTGKSSGTWREIWFDDEARWIYASPSYVNIANVECGTVSASALNVRSGPDTAYRAVGKAKQNSSWVILGSSGAWREIWFGGETRWTHGSYLDQSVAIPNIEVAGFRINNGASSTYSRFVNVSAGYEYSSPTAYRISEKIDFSDTYWRNISNTIALTLTPGEENKRIYFQVKNAQGRWSPVVSDSINYIEPHASGYELSRDNFFQGLRAKFGPLDSSQETGIHFLLDNIEQDTRAAVANQTVWMRQIAYMFATVKHEVANTYQPITEYSDSNCLTYDGGCTFKGRGYVQLTHRYNYEKMSAVAGVDLLASPELALDQDIAYTVMSYGMHYGSFTGRKLGDYIYTGATDYFNARRVINGVDRAQLLSGYAKDFQSIVERSTIKQQQ